jgi:hypothetical protein
MTESEQYIAGVKRLHSFIKPYDYASFVKNAIEYLSTNIGQDDYRKQRWTVALACKWACLHSTGTRQVSKERFIDICNKVYDLQPYAAELKKGKEQGLLSLRPLFLNQYWYQTKNISALLYLSRCHMLMCKKPKAQNYLAQSFESISGIALENFFMMAYVLAKKVFKLETSAFVDIDISDIVFMLLPNVPANEVFAFVNLISLKISELPAYFKEYEDDNYRTQEYFETTPLAYRPFIYINGRLTSLSPKIAINGITELITDFLIKQDATKFIKNYSREYEAYIDELFCSSNIGYLTEMELKKLYEENEIQGKCVDFLLGKKATILTDAKAIQPNNVSLLASANRNLYRNKLKSSFIKGVWQIQETCVNLENISRKNTNTFGLVVTHKDFYFTSAKRYEEQVDPNLSEKITEKYGRLVVPLERIFFVTIRDLEILLTAFEDEAELMSFLTSVEEQESTQIGRTINFSHHIEEGIPNSKWMCHKSLKEFFDCEAELESLWLHRSKRVWANKVDTLYGVTLEFNTKLENKNKC